MCSIYNTFRTCVARLISWRVRLAKQETLTPPGHFWYSPLVLQGSVTCHDRGATIVMVATVTVHRSSKIKFVFYIDAED